MNPAIHPIGCAAETSTGRGLAGRRRGTFEADGFADARGRGRACGTGSALCRAAGRGGRRQEEAQGEGRQGDRPELPTAGDPGLGGDFRARQGRQGQARRGRRHPEQRCPTADDGDEGQVREADESAALRRGQDRDGQLLGRGSTRPLRPAKGKKKHKKTRQEESPGYPLGARPRGLPGQREPGTALRSVRSVALHAALPERLLHGRGSLDGHRPSTGLPVRRDAAEQGRGADRSD